MTDAELKEAIEQDVKREQENCSAEQTHNYRNSLLLVLIVVVVYAGIEILSGDFKSKNFEYVLAILAVLGFIRAEWRNMEDRSKAREIRAIRIECKLDEVLRRQDRSHSNRQ